MVTQAPNLATPEDFTELLIEDDVEDGVDDTHSLEPIVFKLNDEDCGQRLDKVVAKYATQFSRSRLQTWLEAGFILLDGKVARGKSTVYGDETVEILPQPEPEHAAFHPEAIALNIIHEDDALIVINKPAGLVVHPGAGNWSGTLLNGLLHHCPQLANVPRAGIVHRLDKDTSGLMVVGKTLEAHTDLVRQLQARSVKREYWALVWGKPKASGTIDKPMGRHPRERVKMAVSTHESAKPAITHFQRLDSGTLEGRPVSLVACQLETGRTHQIRVHFSAFRHPLLGDTMYGADPKLAARFGIDHQWLHAKELSFEHPITGQPVKFVSDYPAELADVLDKLRNQH